MRSRQEYLDREREQLSPVASLAALTRGRRHAEHEHALRSPFERDRDRIIHSSAFRKLEYKTQVFVNHEGDYYRTRLTHTLEASQITRSLARFLRLNEDLVEAIALVHDVGHPPFGHSGEQALQEAMEAWGGFEHNRQSLRVVDELENRYPSFRGLNLTWEVREGIAKHSKDFRLQHPGTDFAEFADAPHPSLEAQLADVCDEVAYNAHDIDDGLTAGLISLSELREVELWRRLLADCGYTALTEEQTKYLGVRALINAQALDIAAETESRVRQDGIAGPDDARKSVRRTVALGEEMDALNADLRRFLRERVYHNHRVLRMAIKAKRVLLGLFQSYLEHPGQLPPTVLNTRQSPERALCDYLASLTDREALEEHRRLFDPGVT